MSECDYVVMTKVEYVVVTFFLPGYGFISCFISGFPGFRPSLFLLTGRRPGESCHAQSNFILWIPSEDLYLSNYFYISISISLSFASQ